MEQDKLQLYFLLSLLLAGLVLIFVMFMPYLNALLLGAVLAIIFRPFYRKILKSFNGKKVPSALTTVVIVFLLLLMPVVFVGFQIFQEGSQLYGELTAGGEASTILDTAAESIQNFLSTFLPGISLNINEPLKRAAEFLVQNISGIFSGITDFFILVFLGMFAFYYLLKDGAKLRDYFVKLSPLPDEYDRDIFTRLASTVNSVIKGVVSIAFIQGILTGIGFAIFSIPGAALWGAVAAIAALIPSVGTALVLVPGIIYLFLKGSLAAALGLLVWGVVAVGLVDNVLGPKLMQKGGVQMHPFLILLSVLGGIGLFGLSGILIGPLIMSSFAAIADIYNKYLATQN